MKPFLAIDLTDKKNNEQTNGSEFLVQTPSAALANALETSIEKANNTIERSKLPLPLRVIQYVCGMAALLCGMGILKSDVSFEEAYHNAPWAFWIVGVGGAVWLILWILSKLRSKSVLETEESTQTLSHLDRTADAVYTELAVPANAKAVDILMFYYKVKDGTIKLHEKPMQFFQYGNREFKVFADGEHLYLANPEGKYAFPLSSITAIRTVKKHIRIRGWNKDTNFNAGIYKPYKLTIDNYGSIHCKKYHILEISHNGETYGIYIPCYDLPAFEALTGLRAQ